MSAIDQYSHRLISMLECPADDNFVYLSTTRTIAVYELLEDIPMSENDFDGKAGDVLVGGGSGEARALRISIPEIFTDQINARQHYKSFWDNTFAHTIGTGFQKIGWRPEEMSLEEWLVTFVSKKILVREERYAHLVKDA